MGEDTGANANVRDAIKKALLDVAKDNCKRRSFTPDNIAKATDRGLVYYGIQNYAPYAENPQALFNSVANKLTAQGFGLCPIGCEESKSKQEVAPMAKDEAMRMQLVEMEKNKLRASVNTGMMPLNLNDVLAAIDAVVDIFADKK